LRKERCENAAGGRGLDHPHFAGEFADEVGVRAGRNIKLEEVEGRGNDE
jgi:hypothetical protein